MSGIRSVNPATEEELASFEEHTPRDVERTLARAWEVRTGWRDTAVSSRAARFADLTDANVAAASTSVPPALAIAEIVTQSATGRVYAEVGVSTDSRATPPPIGRA